MIDLIPVLISIIFGIFYFFPDFINFKQITSFFGNSSKGGTRDSSKSSLKGSSSVTQSSTPNTLTHSQQDEDLHELIQKIGSDQPAILILWGSQTGTAESFSSRFMKDSIVNGIKCISVDASFYSDYEFLKDLPATYGDGEPTDNARDLYEFIVEQCNHGDLNFNYSVFGLGNSSYEHFNHVSRVVDKRLTSVGCKKLFDRGESDDFYNDTVENSFVEWSSNLLKFLGNTHFKQIFPDFQFGISTQGNIVRSYAFDLVKQSDLGKRLYYTGEHGVVASWNGQQKRVIYDTKNPFYAKILNWKELTDGKDRQVLHIEIDISNANLRYTAGDHVAIYPRNNLQEVELLANVLGIADKLDTVIQMKSYDATSSKKNPFPCPCTLRAVLTYYLDINIRPTTNLLKMFSLYAENDDEKVDLKKLCDDAQYYVKSIVEPGLNIRQVLEKFRSVKIQFMEDYSDIDEMDLLKKKKDAQKVGLEFSNTFTLGDFFEMIPRLQPRYYSISSSPKFSVNNETGEKSIHVTASVVEYKTLAGRQVEGVCTGWLRELCHSSYSQPLSELKPQIMLPIFLRSSTFRLPKNALTPIIMIGPGTGLAPFRGFIQEREILARTKILDYLSKNKGAQLPTRSLVTSLDCPGKLDLQSNVADSQGECLDLNKIVGRSLLFFGCRDRNKDFLYKDEIINEYMQSKDQSIKGFGLTDLICAFSRESDKKIYVQHRISEYSELIWDLLKNKNAYIYVCGDATNMARDVHQALAQCCVSSGNLTSDGANSFIKSLRDKGRYQEDVWS